MSGSLNLRTRRLIPSTHNPGTVGTSVNPPAARRVVTGTEPYTFDVDPGSFGAPMHIVRVATSPHAHARILSIDTSTAEAMDGVVAVFTHENVSTRRFSTGRHEFRTDDPDDSLIFDPVVRFIGQRVAAVVATTAVLWAPHVFVESRRLSVVLLAVGLACFCLHATLLGMLAGADRWSQYGALMVTDAGIRVVIAVATVTLGWGLEGFLWATVGGSLSWLLLLLASPATRAAATLVARESPASFLRGAAHAVAAAGAEALVLECVPAQLAAQITRSIDIPTIGIGASAACDGQVLVVSDMLGMFDWTPKFVRKYADLRSEIDTAVAAYAADVKARRFPAEVETYFSKKPASP